MKNNPLAVEVRVTESKKRLYSVWFPSPCFSSGSDPALLRLTASSPLCAVRDETLPKAELTQVCCTPSFPPPALYFPSHQGVPVPNSMLPS